MMIRKITVPCVPSSAPHRLFAVQMTNDTMSPVALTGDTLFVDPDGEVENGRKVYVKFHDGHVFIAVLITLSERQVTVRQWNPRRDFTFARSRVASMSPVVNPWDPKFSAPKGD